MFLIGDAVKIKGTEDCWHVVAIKDNMLWLQWAGGEFCTVPADDCVAYLDVGDRVTSVDDTQILMVLCVSGDFVWCLNLSSRIPETHTASNLKLVMEDGS